jgi:hypothetical protein
MIIELCKIKLRKELWTYNGKVDLLLKVTLLFLALFYGAMVGLGTEMSDFEEVDLRKATIGFVLILSLFRYYFPNYKAKVNYFHAYHPVPKNHNLFMFFGLELCINFWLNMIVFVITILIVQEVKDYLFALDILGVMFLASMIHRAIHHITESKITPLGKSAILFILISGISCYYYLPYFQFYLIYPALLFGAIYFLEYQIKGDKKMNRFSFNGNVYVKMFFNNSLASNIFLLSLILEIFYFYISTFSENNKFIQFVPIFIPWMFIFYMNFYGLFKSIFFINHQSLQDYTWSRTIMLRMLIIPYSIQSILLLPFAYYYFKDPIFIWSSYIGFTLLIIGMSLTKSILQPYKMAQMMGQKSTWKDIAVGLIVILCTSVLYIVQFYYWALIVHFLIIGLFVAALWVLPALYSKEQYNIWNKLK